MRRDENYFIGHPAEEPYEPSIRFVSDYAAPGQEVLDLGGEEETYVFIASDHDWMQKPCPKGRYVSTAWIPRNLLSEGSLIVDAAISTMDPVQVHFYEQDAVAFEVVDSLDGDSARGDYAGTMPGAFACLQNIARMVRMYHEI